ncbi:hypothetical protein SteCoe_13898 [Stentor coeruleus]|uniref:Uncharacterized protein n=1 Tax=Stentor coeruleus TaxID=5963 RepID=A0A1R2C7B6_9CILI|nr:hypothetical protein SteCoe_13898 [Stentor coeruleus]
MQLSSKFKDLCGCCCSKLNILNEDKLELEIPICRPRGENSIHISSELFNFKSAVPTFASFKESILEPISE